MLERNISDVVLLKIDESLPSFARRFLLEKGTGETEKEFPCELSVRKGFSNRPFRGELLCFDLCRIAEDFFEWKASYKFSHWKYRLYRIGEFHYDLEILGDFGSQWVWPFRTVEFILRILQWKQGYMQMHSAGFYNGRNAVLLMASSGTGKTLTTLHFLCNGGKVYDDDTVTFRHGNLLPTLSKISFWEYRYRNNKNVLPENMPHFSPSLKRKQRFYRFCNLMSMNLLNLGEPIPAMEYWPDCRPPVAPVEKVIVLKKGPEFRKVKDYDKHLCVNRLFGDLTFQCLPLLRIAEIEKMTGYSILDATRFFADNRKFLTDRITTLPFTVFDVPSIYSREIFNQLHEEIMS